MSEYRLKRELNDAQGKIKALENETKRWNTLFATLGQRVDLHGRVVEALILDALKSDHEGLHKQLIDLLTMTKLIHPENAHKVTEQIKAERKAAEDQQLYYQQLLEKRRKMEAEYEIAVRAVETKNSQIDRDNLKVAQGIMDALYERLKGGVSQASLTSEEVKLVTKLQKHETHFKIEHYGILWSNLRWTGAPLKFTNVNHPMVQFLMADRGLSFKQHTQMPKADPFDFRMIGEFY